MKATNNGTIIFGNNEIPFLFDEGKDLLTIYFGNKCIEFPEQLNGIVAHESDKMVGGYIYYSLAVPLSADNCLLVTGDGAKSVATGTHNAEVEFYIENYQSNTSYNEMRFQFAELDYFIPSRNQVEIKDNQFVFSRIKKNLYAFEVDYLGQKIAVSFDVKAECKSSVNARATTISEVAIQFPETNDFEYIVGLYVRVRNFFSFVCNRKNIGLRGATLYGNYPGKTVNENKQPIDTYKGLAQSVNLNVSTLAEDYMCRISKSYIVNVNSCFENFLKSFRHLPGSPTNITEIEKTKEDDWLEWTLNIAFSNIENDIKNDIVICEYYRLIRNCIVHNGESSATLKNKRALIKTTYNSRLNAPNGLDSLTFDDQVLFSRAAYNVAKYIFNNSQYDINAIIKANRENLIDLIKPFQEPGSHSRATKKLKYLIGLSYPELTNVNWEQEVALLLSE